MKQIFKVRYRKNENKYEVFNSLTKEIIKNNFFYKSFALDLATWLNIEHNGIQFLKNI